MNYSQANREPYKRRDDEEAALPPGETCSSCVHFARCADMLSAHPLDEMCDWVPIRFVKATEQASKAEVKP